MPLIKLRFRKESDVLADSARDNRRLLAGQTDFANGPSIYTTERRLAARNKL